MKQRFYLFRRRGTYYLQDSRSGKQQSLETKDRNVAARLLEAKRQLDGEPGFNQFLLKTCLSHSDPMLIRRTWGTVMDEMASHGRESTRTRCSRAMRCRALKSLVSVVHYLKRLHNLALGLGWIAMPILAPRLWPRPELKPKRGITWEEHVGKGTLATIKGVFQENVAKEGAPEEPRWCVVFAELEKPMCLNTTNGQIIAQITGHEDMDDWTGHKIVLYDDPNVSFAGKLTGGIRVRAPKSPAAAPASAEAKPAPATRPSKTTKELPAESDDVPF